MFQHEGNHIGDAWYFVENDICHCYYLTCPVTVTRHTAWDIAHATSSDLIHWNLHGTVIHRGDPGQWDHDCLATGSVVAYGGCYWMAYTGPWCGTLTQIGLAYSFDLYKWEKYPHNPVIKPDESLFSQHGRGIRKFCHWRDAKLYVHNDRLYALICATSRHAPEDACGSVAVVSTDDLQNWSVEGEIEIEAICQELECPQIQKVDNHYVLLFSCFKDLFSPSMQNKYGGYLRQTSYYLISAQPKGPYQFVPDFTLLPNDPQKPEESLQYANQLVLFQGKWYLLGTIWSDFGDCISDPYLIHMSEDRLTAEPISGESF